MAGLQELGQAAWAGLLAVVRDAAVYVDDVMAERIAWGVGTGALYERGARVVRRLPLESSTLPETDLVGFDAVRQLVIVVHALDEATMGYVHDVVGRMGSTSPRGCMVFCALSDRDHTLLPRADVDARTTSTSSHPLTASPRNLSGASAYDQFITQCESWFPPVVRKADVWTGCIVTHLEVPIAPLGSSHGFLVPVPTDAHEHARHIHLTSHLSVMLELMRAGDVDVWSCGRESAAIGTVLAQHPRRAGPDRATVILVDRDLDIATPLLHQPSVGDRIFNTLPPLAPATSDVKVV